MASLAPILRTMTGLRCLVLAGGGSWAPRWGLVGPASGHTRGYFPFRSKEAHVRCTLTAQPSQPNPAAQAFIAPLLPVPSLPCSTDNPCPSDAVDSLPDALGAMPGLHQLDVSGCGLDGSTLVRVVEAALRPSSRVAHLKYAARSLSMRWGMAFWTGEPLPGGVCALRL